MMKEDRNLQAAIGYFGLGMLEEANNEIECIPPDQKNSSEVLGVRMEIYRAAEKWTLMEVVAREIWKRHKDQPVCWNDLAWATRRAVGIEKAFEILSQAVQNFPEDAMTNNNLGCYQCKMGEIEKAQERVGKAIKLDGRFKLWALDALYYQ
jgi:tetratricopeptide (TPR) repeat protein